MSFVAVFMRGDRIYHVDIPESGKVTIGSGEKDALQISEYKKEELHISVKNDWVEVTGKSFTWPDTVRYGVGGMFSLPFEPQVNPVLGVYVRTGRAKEVLKLPYSGMVRIGRDEKQNDVVLRSKMISRAPYIRLLVEGGSVRVENRVIDGHRSTNDLYHNGRRVTNALLHTGDVLTILAVRMVYKGGCLYFENVPEGVLVKNLEDAVPAPAEAPRPNPVPKRPTLAFSRSASTEPPLPSAPEEEAFCISPRLRSKLPDRKIVLAAPPAPPTKPVKTGVMSKILGPAGMVISTAVMGLTSPAMLVARAASLISPVASSISGIKLGKKKSQEASEYFKELYEKYSDYIEEQTNRITVAAEEQRTIITQENPAPEASISIARQRKKQLWERRVKDNDFMHVRMGMGYERLCVPVVTNAKEHGFEMEYNELRDMLDYVIEATRNVDKVPARLNMQEHPLIGIQGNREQRNGFVRNLLVNLTAVHSYEDVRIVGFFDEEDEQDWAEMRWLPHVWDENNQMRYLAFNGAQRSRLAELFDAILKDRRENMENEEFRDVVRQTPFYLFLVGSKKCLENLRSRKDNLDLDFKNTLLNSCSQMCVSTLLLYNNTGKECEYFVNLNEKVEVTDEKVKAIDSASAFDANAVNRKYIFTPDAPVDMNTFSAYTRDLASVKLEKSGGKKALPDGITFLQGYGVRSVEQLNVCRHWQKRAESCAFAAPIGVLETGQPFSLDLNAHGPHGLVAGGTGSGKSEMLKAWILSVCIHYHPHDVNFVIIDYKGGGLANNLEKLPHVVGSITNIGSGIYRSMSSLSYELKRRQELFAKVGASDYSEYKKAYRKGLTAEWLPLLVLVSDEFRQLKEQEPDFIKSLINVAVIGRSLGIRMVLSTQSPAGVVDENIDANVSFRICLKTNTAADSTNMLKTPDAFKITRPGRCYVRVGGGEVYEQVQTYWSGAAYFGDNGEAESAVNKAKRVEITGVRVEREADKNQSTDVTEQMAIIEHLQKVAADMGIKKLPAPWKPDLPEVLFPEDLPVEGGFDGNTWRPNGLNWLRIPVGLYDLPELQEQGMQMLDFFAHGHYGIFGAGGTGKTTLLKTIITQACRYYSPDDIVFYGIDYGSWSLYNLCAFPHVGDVVRTGETEKLGKLMNTLLKEMERRQKLFHKHNVTSLAAYRKSVGRDLPATVLVIDNITGLFDSFAPTDASALTLESQIMKIVQEGAGYGMHLLFTANGYNGVKYKLIGAVGGRIAFSLTDASDYSSLVGKSETPLPKNIVGRAYFKGKPPTQFQAALWENHREEEELNRLTEALGKQMSQAWTGNLPVNVPIMPETVAAEHLVKGYTSRTSLIFGMDYNTVAPAVMDLSENYGVLVTGGVKSGKSRLLYNTVRTYLRRYPDTLLYVLDSEGKPLRDLKEDCAFYGTNSNPDTISDMIRRLGATLTERQHMKADGGVEEQPAVLLCLDDEIATYKAMYNEDVKPLTSIMRNGKGIGFMVLAAGRMGDVSLYHNGQEPLQYLLKHRKGVAVSNSPRTHEAYFKFGVETLEYSEKDLSIAQGSGMYFEADKCRRIKLIGEE